MLANIPSVLKTVMVLVTLNLVITRRTNSTDNFSQTSFAEDWVGSMVYTPLMWKGTWHFFFQLDL